MHHFRKFPRLHKVIIAFICTSLLVVALVRIVPRTPPEESVSNTNAQSGVRDEGHDPSKAAKREDLNRDGLGPPGFPDTNEERWRLIDFYLQFKTGCFTPAGYPDANIRSLLRDWFSKDPEEAKRALALLDAHTRQSVLIEAVDLWHTDPKRILEIGRSFLEDEDSFTTFVASAVGRIATLDPDSAFHLISTLEGSPQIEGYRTAFSRFGESDTMTVQQALSFLDRMDRESTIATVLQDYLLARDEFDLQEFNHFTGTIDRASGYSHGPLYESALGRYFTHLTSTHDLRDAVQMASQLEMNDPIRQTIIRIAMGRHHDEPFTERATYLMESEVWRPGMDDAVVVGSILRNGSRSDLFEFVDSVERLPNVDAPAVFASAASALLGADELEATRWVESLPPGPNRNAALEVIIQRFRQLGRDQQVEELLDLSPGS